MIPQKTDGRWVRLINGKLSHNFKLVPAGLMLSRLRRQFSSAISPKNERECVDELYDFFQKYERILQEDIKAIFGEETRNAD